MIQTTNENTARFGKYEGFTTSLLIGESNTGCDEISIQVTNIEPGKMQTVHKHPQYQCYYIIQGIGQVIIDEEVKELEQGNAVLIPANELHGIKNIGEGILQYLTANKAFGTEREKEIWFSEKVIQGQKYKILHMGCKPSFKRN